MLGGKMFLKFTLILLGTFLVNDSHAGMVVSANGIQGCSLNGGKIKVNFGTSTGVTGPFTIQALNSSNAVVKTMSSSTLGQVHLLDLPSGAYTAKVTDSVGQVGSAAVVVPAYSPLLINASITHVYSTATNLSPSTGAIDVTVTGGQTPEVFIWSKGTSATGTFTQINYQNGVTLANAPDLTNLSKGFYKFHIYTINGCSYNKLYEVKLNPSTTSSNQQTQ